MVSMIGSVTILIAMSSTGGIFFNRNPNNMVQPPLPGYGAGFTNGNPDGYGWIDNRDYLPLTADRTPDYYFHRNAMAIRPRKCSCRITTTRTCRGASDSSLTRAAAVPTRSADPPRGRRWKRSILIMRP